MTASPGTLAAASGNDGTTAKCVAHITVSVKLKMLYDTSAGPVFQLLSPRPLYGAGRGSWKDDIVPWPGSRTQSGLIYFAVFWNALLISILHCHGGTDVIAHKLCIPQHDYAQHL